MLVEAVTENVIHCAVKAVKLNVRVQHIRTVLISRRWKNTGNGHLFQPRTPFHLLFCYTERVFCYTERKLV